MTEINQESNAKDIAIEQKIKVFKNSDKTETSDNKASNNKASNNKASNNKASNNKTVDKFVEKQILEMMINSLIILIIGDPHFKTSNVLETEEMTKRIISIAKEIKPDFIVNLGDTLDRHDLINIKPLVQATNFMEDLSKIAPVYMLIGNHDRPNNSDFLTKFHPFIGLKSMPNITIVDTIIIREIKGYKFTFAPYVSNGRLVEALNNKTKNDWMVSDIIFAHQELRGAKMGHIISENGDEWLDEYPYMISGHLHDKQELKNAYYPGTPISHGFADTQDKAISVLTLNKGSKKIDRYDLGLPKKKIIKVTYADLKTVVIPDNTHVKLVITGTDAEIQSLKSQLKSNNMLKISYIKSSVISQTVNDVNKRNMSFKNRLLEKLTANQKKLIGIF